jgi:uncharacterized protein YndB with AHSA1/START domain
METHAGAAAHEGTGAQPLQVRRIFKAAPERLFAAWTTAEELTRWHAPGALSVVLAEVDLRPGGRYRIEMAEPAGGTVHKVSGTYRVVDPPRKLVYTWRWEGEPIETQVTLEFHPAGTGTELVLTHHGFANEDARAHHEKGWTAIMESLHAHISTVA